jgi:hypothetical protein
MMYLLLSFLMCLALAYFCDAADLYGIKFNRILGKKTTVDDVVKIAPNSGCQKQKCTFVVFILVLFKFFAKCVCV